MKKCVSVFVFYFICAIFLFPADSSASMESSKDAEPYKIDEFPQWVYDVRQGEIITLGSLPFTMLGVTLTYSSIQYFSALANGNSSSSFPNPLDRSSYSEDDLKKIVGISLGVSFAVGLTDLIISIIGRKNSENRLKKLQAASSGMTAIPITPEEAGDLFRHSEEEKIDQVDETEK